MKEKIDFEDMSSVADAGTGGDVGQLGSGESERIKEICSIGEEEAITTKMATGLPATVLVMSIVNFVPMANEVTRAVEYSAMTGDSNTVQKLKAAFKVMQDSYMACGNELDARLPARATAEEAGLASGNSPSDQDRKE